jgi:hypothetical protein
MELGVDVDAGRDAQRRCIEEAGICFCFAIHHHPATRHVMPVRKALGFPTIFNLLGPLTNPAGARRQVMGVYAPQFVRPIAEALARLGSVHAIVMHGADGIDECSITAPTLLAEVRDGQVVERTITPQEFGIEPVSHEALQARDLQHAAELVRGLLLGNVHGAPRDHGQRRKAGDAADRQPRQPARRRHSHVEHQLPPFLRDDGAAGLRRDAMGAHQRRQRLGPWRHAAGHLSDQRRQHGCHEWNPVFLWNFLY